MGLDHSHAFCSVQNANDISVPRERKNKICKHQTNVSNKDVSFPVHDLWIDQWIRQQNAFSSPLPVHYVWCFSFSFPSTLLFTLTPLSQLNSYKLVLWNKMVLWNIGGKKKYWRLHIDLCYLSQPYFSYYLGGLIRLLDWFEPTPLSICLVGWKNLWK